MKMIFFTDKSLLTKAKMVCKTLVVLILSVLLFAPTPALALQDYSIPQAIPVTQPVYVVPTLGLDYNNTIQSYISNTKVELGGILTAIKKLPTLSYENGKTTVAEINSKLEKIQADAGKNTANFQNLSNEAQMKYQEVLDAIKNLKPLPIIGKVGYPREILEQKIRERQRYEDYKNALDIQSKNLANGIVLTNKISQLCDNFAKRVNLAKQKAGNVKEYSDALRSFSDPDILGEISELDKFIADLTQNLSLGS
ncbi:MAG: hypothetical protein VKL59_02350 [Nostocaceae cyanobacterium]|nr:hypothetical protein [Nostocaceae cyanobacterium]